jgi:SAM-dependent methyltransferase
MSNFVTINERGEFFLNNSDKKITKLEACQDILLQLRLDSSFCLTTKINDISYIVEAFDFPLKAHAVSFQNKKLLIHVDYNLTFEADPNLWAVDGNDEFYGLTTSSAPFKLSLNAQTQLFNLCDEYDDDSFTIKNIRFETPSYYIKNEDVKKTSFWNQAYQNESAPGWDLDQPAEAFKDMLPRLKFPKSRILVLGCGVGHDAALFAEVGHVVTAIDFSNEAIDQAKKKYGHIHNLTFECMDVFNLPQSWNFSFDVIIEHTLFCALSIEQRTDLLKVWKRLLHEEGQLMSVFYTMFKRYGPPYGVTELEIRSLLMPHFQFLFWGRLRNSLPQRLGKELFVLGKKR